MENVPATSDSVISPHDLSDIPDGKRKREAVEENLCAQSDTPEHSPDTDKKELELQEDGQVDRAPKRPRQDNVEQNVQADIPTPEKTVEGDNETHRQHVVELPGTAAASTQGHVATDQLGHTISLETHSDGVVDQAKVDLRQSNQEAREPGEKLRLPAGLKDNLNPALPMSGPGAGSRSDLGLHNDDKYFQDLKRGLSGSGGSAFPIPPLPDFDRAFFRNLRQGANGSPIVPSNPSAAGSQRGENVKLSVLQESIRQAEADLASLERALNAPIESFSDMGRETSGRGLTEFPLMMPFPTMMPKPSYNLGNFGALTGIQPDYMLASSSSSMPMPPSFDATLLARLRSGEGVAGPSSRPMPSAYDIHEQIMADLLPGPGLGEGVAGPSSMPMLSGLSKYDKEVEADMAALFTRPRPGGVAGLSSMPALDKANMAAMLAGLRSGTGAAGPSSKPMPSTYEAQREANPASDQAPPAGLQPSQGVAGPSSSAMSPFELPATRAFLAGLSHNHPLLSMGKSGSPLTRPNPPREGDTYVGKGKGRAF